MPKMAVGKRGNRNREVYHWNFLEQWFFFFLFFLLDTQRFLSLFLELFNEISYNFFFGSFCFHSRKQKDSVSCFIFCFFLI